MPKNQEGGEGEGHEKSREEAEGGVFGRGENGCVGVSGRELCSARSVAITR